MESGGDQSTAGHIDRRDYRESQPRCLQGKYPQKHAEEALLGGGSILALQGECKLVGQEGQYSAKQQR